MNQLPKCVRINGQDITSRFREVHSYGVDFEPYELLFAQSHAVRFVVTRREGRDIRWQIFNAVEDPSASPLRLTWEGDAGAGGPHWIGSGEGFAFHDIDATGVTGSTSWDGYMDDQVENGSGVDIPNTSSAGSANMEFHSPEALIMAREGVSPSGYRWLNAYLSYSLLRNRHRWQSIVPFGADGQLRGKIVGFNPMAENGHGVNAYDSQHLDATELYEGWRLTGDPAFLLELIHLWCHAAQHERAFSEPERAYNARDIGWPLLLADYLINATQRHAEVFAGLRTQAIAFVDRATTYLRTSVPIVDPYAKPQRWELDGVPVAQGTEGAVRVRYAPIWMYAPVMFACELLRKTLVGMGETQFVVAELSDQLFELANHEWFDGPGMIVRNIYNTGEREYAGPEGVCGWFAAALARRDNPGPLGQYLIDWYLEEYEHRAHVPYRYSYAMNLIPRQLGFDT